MAFGKILFAASVLGLAIWGLADENKRKSSEIAYSSSLTKADFEKIAVDAAKPIKRLWVTADCPIVYGTVQSESGISYWKFTLDFNDYGKLTGKYWKNTDNSDSSIPEKLGEKIKNEIISRIGVDGEQV